MAPRRARVLGEQPDHAEALRRHLITVTQRLLSSHGLGALTTRSIAREAQVADGVLYNHFADKDDLVVSALSEQLADLGERFAQECPRPGAQDLRAGLGALVVRCRRFGAEAFPLVAGLLGRPDLVHELFNRLHATDDAVAPIIWRDVLGFLAAEQQLGTLSDEVQVEAVAALIVGATQLGALRDPAAAAAASDDADEDPDTAGLVSVLVRACRP